MSTQFVKSPPVPADSQLWKIGKKWRISQTKNVGYTELENIVSQEKDVDIPSLVELLHKQLDGKLKQSIDYVNHRLVASYLPDGKIFVYGYTPDREAEAEKKASYNNGVVPEGAKRPQNVAQQTFNSQPQTSNTAASSTVQVSAHTRSPPTITKQQLEVPFDLRPLKWNDLEGIQDAINDGLYPLPVKHTGVENWGFIGEMSGERTFWYGRIKLIEVD